MTESRAGQLIELETILANQRALGKRFVWLLILPLVLSAVLLAMFYVTSRRLTDVEVVTRQLTIERLLADDSNYKMAVEQYKQIARVRETPPSWRGLVCYFFNLITKATRSRQSTHCKKGFDSTRAIGKHTDI